MSNRIGIASDHGGKILKEKVSVFLRSQGWDVKDFGPSVQSQESVDYPDFAAMLGREVSSGSLPRGILICGTGIGMSIAANKISGIRATVVWDEFTAKVSRQHNDSNVLCLGERVLNHDRAIDFLSLWLEIPFEGGRHQNRVNKISQLERT